MLSFRSGVSNYVSCETWLSRWGETNLCFHEVPLTSSPHPVKIISYEGSTYKTDFWEGQGREFEDRTERLALRQLLPASGHTLIEVGAGFGRLADLYQGYQRVILVDYSTTLLSEAREHLGHDARYMYVAANVYHLPFVDHVADVVVMIRVAHHLAAVDLALAEIYRVMQGGRPFIMEFANKRHLKAIVRYALGKQPWSPFDPFPYEFVPLNFDFHPSWMRQQLMAAGFRVERELAISHFRLPALKRRIPPQWLARLDNALAGPGAWLKLSPSVLTKNVALKPPTSPAGFLRCPACGSQRLVADGSQHTCQECGRSWPIRDGIFDFRYPRPEDAP